MYITTICLFLLKVAQCPSNAFKNVILNCRSTGIQPCPSNGFMTAWWPKLQPTHVGTSPHAFNAVKSRLERRRAGVMPPIPHALQDVAVGGEWALSWGGDEFLSKHDHRHGFLVFATEDSVTKLQQCDQVRN